MSDPRTHQGAIGMLPGGFGGRSQIVAPVHAVRQPARRRRRATCSKFIYNNGWGTTAFVLSPDASTIYDLSDFRWIDQYDYEDNWSGTSHVRTYYDADEGSPALTGLDGVYPFLVGNLSVRHRWPSGEVAPAIADTGLIYVWLFDDNSLDQYPALVEIDLAGLTANVIYVSPISVSSGDPFLDIVCTWHPSDPDAIYNWSALDDQFFRVEISTGTRTDIANWTFDGSAFDGGGTWGAAQYATGVAIHSSPSFSEIFVYDIVADSYTICVLDFGIRGWALNQAGDFWYTDDTFSGVVHQGKIPAAPFAGTTFPDVPTTCADALFDPTAEQLAEPACWLSNADRTLVLATDGDGWFDLSS